MKQPELWISMEDLRRHSPTAVVDPVDVLTDAFGREWIANAVAKRAIERVKAEEQAELDARQTYARYLDDRTQRRHEIAERIRNDVLGGSAATPASSGVIHGRLQEVLTQFDEAEPELGYYEWRDRRPSMKAARA
jgi:hypothetical protein